ncbi:MAG: PAS domain S-box protein [Candidatus Methanoperedens sp.]|nr:PAS domain S-box protein [Candidatus Methanoperedens sp.]
MKDIYYNILDNASEAIIAADLDNNIILWNKSAEKIFGWKLS